MKRISILLALLVICSTSFSQKKPKIKGDKDVTTTTERILKKFNAIEVDDELEVSLKQGDENSYSLTTDRNLQEIIQFSVRDSVLKIYTTNKITSHKKLAINLTFITLEHITIKNDAQVSSEGRIEGHVVYVNAYNSSQFDLDIRATDLIVTMQRNTDGQLKSRTTNTTIVMNDRTDLDASVIAEKTTVTLTKSAQLNLAGDCDLVVFSLKDKTELDAREMKATAADLYTSNKSDVYVYAGRNLEIYAKGKSNIYVYGDPKIEIKGLTDQSKIIKK